MPRWMTKHWFLICLVILIAVGVVWGSRESTSASAVARQVHASWLTVAILFCMSFSLETSQLRASLRSPGPVVVASILNLGLAPLLAWGLLPVQTVPDFRLGLMVACSVPCTMAAASVWTRKAHGNDAISLLVTLLTNTSCVLISPFWLALTLSAGESAAGPLLDPRDMINELLISVLLPIGLGQLLQQIPQLGRLAKSYKGQISMLAQCLILVIVFTGALKGGIRIQETQSAPGVTGILVVWGSTILVHVAVLWAGLVLGKLIRMRPADQIAVALAGSQKTLPVGLLIAESLSRSSGLSFIVFPMLMYHASQLFIDTLVVERHASRHAERPV